MSIQFPCNSCGKPLAAEEKFIGEVIQCPHCQTQQPVPAQGQGAPPGVAGTPGTPPVPRTPPTPRTPRQRSPQPGYGPPPGYPQQGGYPPPPGGYPPPPGAYPQRGAYGRRGGMYGRSQQEHPKATMILVFGILGFVLCGVFGIVAWVMGNGARGEIARGLYAESGSVTAGWVLGIIATLLNVGVIILYVVMMAAFSAY